MVDNYDNHTFLRVYYVVSDGRIRVTRPYKIYTFKVSP